MRTSWLSATKQEWKVIPFYLLLLLSAILLVAFIAIGVQAEPQEHWMAVGFTACGAAALAWLFTTVRCCKCGGRVAWWIARHSAAESWVTQIHALERCPMCGSDGNIHDT